ncbi:hypothetical protein Slin15195_G076490 [Septoria linicola]|uniref:Uncharacterized protein n=1 Tax=Septoria linicola TaxID=215465 RepID=A0A9Q9EKR7_9PEZI|nr:hypothetical protein Slin15195_G076490 [Septoria linicola]
MEPTTSEAELLAEQARRTSRNENIDSLLTTLGRADQGADNENDEAVLALQRSLGEKLLEERAKHSARIAELQDMLEHFERLKQVRSDLETLRQQKQDISVELTNASTRHQHETTRLASRHESEHNGRKDTLAKAELRRKAANDALAAAQVESKEADAQVKDLREQDTAANKNSRQERLDSKAAHEAELSRLQTSLQNHENELARKEMGLQSLSPEIRHSSDLRPREQLKEGTLDETRQSGVQRHSPDQDPGAESAEGHFDRSEHTTTPALKATPSCLPRAWTASDAGEVPPTFETEASAAVPRKLMTEDQIAIRRDLSNYKGAYRGPSGTRASCETSMPKAIKDKKKRQSIDSSTRPAMTYGKEIHECSLSEEYPMVVYVQDQWCELKCFICHTNISSETCTYFAHITPLVQHIAQSHGKVARDEVAAKCIAQSLIPGDVQLLLAGKDPLVASPIRTTIGDPARRRFRLDEEIDAASIRVDSVTLESPSDGLPTVVESEASEDEVHGPTSPDTIRVARARTKGSELRGLIKSDEKHITPGCLAETTSASGQQALTPKPMDNRSAKEEVPSVTSELTSLGLVHEVAKPINFKLKPQCGSKPSTASSAGEAQQLDVNRRLVMENKVPTRRLISPGILRPNSPETACIDGRWYMIRCRICANANKVTDPFRGIQGLAEHVQQRHGKPAKLAKLHDIRAWCDYSIIHGDPKPTIDRITAGKPIHEVIDRGGGLSMLDDSTTRALSAGAENPSATTAQKRTFSKRNHIAIAAKNPHILHSSYPTTVHVEGEWYTISCAICTANASDTGAPFWGLQGLAAHVKAKHDEPISLQNITLWCTLGGPIDRRDVRQINDTGHSSSFTVPLSSGRPQLPAVDPTRDPRLQSRNLPKSRLALDTTVSPAPFSRSALPLGTSVTSRTPGDGENRRREQRDGWMSSVVAPEGFTELRNRPALPTVRPAISRRSSSGDSPPTKRGKTDLQDRSLY